MEADTTRPKTGAFPEGAAQESAIHDDEPRSEPDETLVVGSQLEHGSILHACSMTVGSRKIIHPRSIEDVAAIDLEEGGNSGGAGAGAEGPWNYQKKSWIMKQRARSAKRYARKLPRIGRRPR